MAKKRKSRGSGASAPVSPRRRTIGGLDEYEVKNALESLTRAEQVRGDAKMMKAVGIEARRQTAAIKKATKGSK